MGLVLFGFIILGIVLMVGALLAPLYSRWREAAAEIANRNNNLAGIEKSMQVQKDMRNSDKPRPKYYDPQIDEHISSGNLEAATSLAREKLQHAHQLGSQSREQLYRTYVDRLAELSGQR